jgi:Helix-turn-helix of DDE superfamily endonuclease
MLLVYYYRLYITYTLAGFLFDLDQSSICRDIQKIESLIRKCLPILQKIYNMTKKRLRTPDEVEKYFSVDFLAFIYSTHNNKSQNLLTRIKEKNVLSWKEKET